MKYPFLKLAIAAGAAVLIFSAVKKVKETMEKQAEKDAEAAEKAAEEALKIEAERSKTAELKVDQWSL